MITWNEVFILLEERFRKNQARSFLEQYK